MAAVVTLLILFRRIFQPLLLGLGLAYLFDPMVSWFENRGRSRTLGVVVLATGLVLALIGVLLFVIPTIGEQFDNLAEKLPRYQERIRQLVKPLFDRIEARYPDEVGELQQRLIDGLRENLPKVAGSLGQRLKSLFGNLLDVLLFLLNLVFVPVFAFYLLVDWPKLKKGIVGLIPVPYREVSLARVKEVDVAVASFLRGQLTIALILAAINATGLVALGVPFGLALGLIAGLANMIPYMALVVGLLPAVLLCWAEHQSWPLVLGVIAVFSGAQLLEGTVLSPRILSKSVNLHPVWVLLAIIAGGSLFGFVGLLIAVPAAAAIQVFTRHWLQLYRASAIFGRPPELIDSESAESLEEAPDERVGLARIGSDSLDPQPISKQASPGSQSTLALETRPQARCPTSLTFTSTASTACSTAPTAWTTCSSAPRRAACPPWPSPITATCSAPWSSTSGRARSASSRSSASRPTSRRAAGAIATRRGAATTTWCCSPRTRPASAI